jgi:hypothetical protein
MKANFALKLGTLVATAVTLSFLPIPATPAQAAVLNLGNGVTADIQKNDRSRLLILFMGGPVIFPGFNINFSIPGGIWSGTIKISAEDFGNQDIIQFVSATGIRHEQGPHIGVDQNPGQPFTLPIRVISFLQNPPQIDPIIMSTVNHVPHKDMYTAGFINFTNNNNNITSWKFQLEGQHTPEPSSIIGLLVTSALVISSSIFKKLE